MARQYKLADLNALDRQLAENWRWIHRGGRQPKAVDLASHRHLAEHRQEVSVALARQRRGGTMGTFRRRRAAPVHRHSHGRAR